LRALGAPVRFPVTWLGQQTSAGLRRRLCLSQNSYKSVKIGGVYVADGDGGPGSVYRRNGQPVALELVPRLDPGESAEADSDLRMRPSASTNDTSAINDTRVWEESLYIADSQAESPTRLPELRDRNIDSLVEITKILRLGQTRLLSSSLVITSPGRSSKTSSSFSGLLLDSDPHTGFAHFRPIEEKTS